LGHGNRSPPLVRFGHLVHEPAGVYTAIRVRTLGPLGLIGYPPGPLTALRRSPLMDRLDGLNDWLEPIGIPSESHGEGGRIKVPEASIELKAADRTLRPDI
jgi:hypothetical protein